MKFLKNNFWTLFGLALVFTVAVTGDASAQALNSSTIASTTFKKAGNLFRNIRTLVFILGGFGLVGLATSAIFGKIKWPWFGALAVGLGVLAAAGAIINYATGDSQVTDGDARFADTFGASGDSR